MKKLILNVNNLNFNDIDEEVTRVKALMINSKNEILLGLAYNEYQFPGGHLEKNEKPEDGMIREIKEETGIDVNKDELIPFMMLKHLSKNYFNSGKNRCNTIIYYVVKTDKRININDTAYTNYEKEGEFSLHYYKLDEVEELLIDHSSKNPKFKGIAYEMLQVLYEYRNNSNI